MHVITWTAMLQIYNTHERLNEAWRLYLEMKGIGMNFDEHAFSTILTIIDKMKNLQESCIVHQQMKVFSNNPNYLLNFQFIESVWKCR